MAELKIKRTVRLDGRAYRADNKDDAKALLENADAKTLSSLKERKLITGDVKKAAKANAQTQTSENNGGDELPAGFPARMQLIKAGFDTTDKVAAAGDEELAAIEGVGDATVAKIREAVK